MTANSSAQAVFRPTVVYGAHDNCLQRVQIRDLVAKEGLRPWTPSGSSWGNLSRLLQRCWHRDPARRPDFDTIVVEIERMLEAALPGSFP